MLVYAWATHSSSHDAVQHHPRAHPDARSLSDGVRMVPSAPLTSAVMATVIVDRAVATSATLLPDLAFESSLGTGHCQQQIPLHREDLEEEVPAPKSRIVAFPRHQSVPPSMAGHILVDPRPSRPSSSTGPPPGDSSARGS